MKKRKFGIISILAIALSFWLGVQWESFWYNDKCLDLGGGRNSDNYPICVVEEKRDADVLNATYTIEDESFSLVNGVAEKEILPGAASKILVRVFSMQFLGDFDRNDFDESAVVLTFDGGGSGTFYYLSVFDGKKSSNAVLLGDRIDFHSVKRLENREIIANFSKRKESESFAGLPTLMTSVHFTFSEGNLQQMDKKK